MITSACNFARKLHGANVQSPSNHQELASIGQDKHNGMMAIKGMARGEGWQCYTFRRCSSPVDVEASCLPTNFGGGR